MCILHYIENNKSEIISKSEITLLDIIEFASKNKSGNYSITFDFLKSYIERRKELFNTKKARGREYEIFSTLPPILANLNLEEYQKRLVPDSELDVKLYNHGTDFTELINFFHLNLKK